MLSTEVCNCKSEVHNLQSVLENHFQDIKCQAINSSHSILTVKLPFEGMITKTIMHYISTVSRYYYLLVMVNKNTAVTKRVTYFAIASTVIKPLLPSQMTLDTSTSNVELHLSFLYTEICLITCQRLSRLQSNYITITQPCRKIQNYFKTATTLG